MIFDLFSNLNTYVIQPQVDKWWSTLFIFLMRKNYTGCLFTIEDNFVFSSRTATNGGNRAIV